MAYGTRQNMTATEARQWIRFCASKLEEILHDAEGGTWNGAWYRDGDVLRFDMLCEDGRTAFAVSARTWSDLNVMVGSMLDAALVGMKAVKDDEARS